MNLNKKLLWLLIPVTIFFTVIFLYFKEVKTNNTFANQIKALTDTAKLYRLKSGASGAEKLVFTGTKDDILAALKAKDKTAYNYVKNTSGIQSYSSVNTKVKVDTVVKADTVYMVRDSLTGKLKFYLTKDIKEPKGFYNAQVKVENDSVSLKLDLTDRYNIITHEKNNGFLKGKSLVLTVENTNPYVHITGAQSFIIQPKNKQLGLKIGGVIAVGLGTFLLLHK